MTAWALLHRAWQCDVLGMLTNAPISPSLFADGELDIDWPMLSYTQLEPVQWRSQMMFITVQNLDARILADTWERLVSFYDDAGPLHRHVSLQQLGKDFVIAYWVGDVCESGAVTRVHSRLRPQHVRSDFEYVHRHEIAADFACAVDPTGEIAVVRADKISHAVFQRYLASKRAELNP
jgi:hypothetical protein